MLGRAGIPPALSYVLSPFARGFAALLAESLWLSDTARIYFRLSLGGVAASIWGLIGKAQPFRKEGGQAELYAPLRICN